MEEKKVDVGAEKHNRKNGNKREGSLREKERERKRERLLLMSLRHH